MNVEPIKPPLFFPAHALLRPSFWAALLVSVVVLSGCASTADLPTATYVAPAKSAAATLYVYRDLSMPTKANVDIQVDGKVVAYLPNNRFTWVSVPAGTRTIAVGTPSFPDMRARLQIEFAPGESYLLKYDSAFRGEAPLFGSRRDPIPGVTDNGQGGYTRIRLQSNNAIPDVVKSHGYVVGAP